MLTFLRYLWAGPNSGVGLFFAMLASVTGGHTDVVDGVLEASGGALTRILALMPTSGSLRKPAGAAALTLGHVVIAIDQAALDRTRAHERVHVHQYERWGPFFLPAYALASLIAASKKQHPYLDNHFEREAYTTTTLDTPSPPTQPPL